MIVCDFCRVGFEEFELPVVHGHLMAFMNSLQNHSSIQVCFSCLDKMVKEFKMPPFQTKGWERRKVVME